ncbi:hypothetical protein [Sphingopyxis sp. BSNA05]|nr:hypothetical protein [Sphingopyxis sp. BSNA05]
MVETINDGEAKTPFMSAGDSVEIRMQDADGHSCDGLMRLIIK